MFNHPPLMGLFAWVSLEVSMLFGVAFHIIFKSFMIFAHIATAVLLRNIWSAKSSHRNALWVFAAFTWALSSILVAAFHGNTDTLIALFCLLVLYFIYQQKYGLAGIAFALAFNVKIIPLILFCPLLAGIRDKRNILLFGLGAAIGVIPYIITWIGAGPAFIENIFGYGSNIVPWGIQLLLVLLDPFVQFETTVPAYRTFGKLLIIALILLLSIIGYIRDWSPPVLTACAFIIFLIFAPGFGVQYIVYLTPIIFLISPLWGFIYAMLSGLFLGSIYYHFLTPEYPFQSVHNGNYSSISTIIGLLVWYFLVLLLWKILSNKPSSTNK